MKKVLIIKSRNIGDVLLTGPLCSAIHQSAADVQITVLVKKGTEAMLLHHPHIHCVETFPFRQKNESGWHFFRRQLRWFRQLRQREFDIAINTTEGDRGAITAWMSGASERIGLHNPHKPPRWNRRLMTKSQSLDQAMMHTVLKNLALRPDGVESYRRVHLDCSAESEQQCAAILKQAGCDESLPIVQVHPVSRWFFKCWTDSGMAEVLDYLQQHWQCQVVVTAAPDQKERDKLDTILSLCQHQPIDLGGRLNLDQMIALGKCAKLFFGVDTAPMHMAAALDVPVVAIFGPSGVFEWGPWPNDWQGSGVTPYPQRHGRQSCFPHVVLQQGFSCVPCGQAGCNNSKRSECLETLTVDEVIQNLEGSLQQAGFKRKTLR